LTDETTRLALKASDGTQLPAAQVRLDQTKHARGRRRLFE
jgi:hypothetical protein